MLGHSPPCWTDSLKTERILVYWANQKLEYHFMAGKIGNRILKMKRFRVYQVLRVIVPRRNEVQSVNLAFDWRTQLSCLEVKGHTTMKAHFTNFCIHHEFLFSWGLSFYLTFYPTYPYHGGTMQIARQGQSRHSQGGHLTLWIAQTCMQPQLQVGLGGRGVGV